MVVATRTKCIHHELVDPVPWEIAFQLDRRIFEVLWLLYFLLSFFFFTLTLFVLVGVLVSPAILCGSRILNQLHFLVLENVHEGHSCHVRIICCLVVVRKQLGTFIVRASILLIKPELDVRLEFLVTGALVVDFTKACLEEGF